MVRREARSAVNRCFQLLWPWFVASNDGAAVIARYGWDEVRFSISWKAYCFADERERRAWRGHGDDLVLERILNRLVDDLRARGRLRSDPMKASMASSESGASRTPPSGSASTSSRKPLRQRSRCRTGFGITTCPLLVSRVAHFILPPGKIPDAAGQAGVSAPHRTLGETSRTLRAASVSP